MPPFAGGQVYGGYAGFFDYGPLGVELRQNIKNAWWRDMVHRRDDIVGLDSSIIASPKIWKASGHLDGFSDPMVDCKTSKLRYRADQLFWARAEVRGPHQALRSHGMRPSQLLSHMCSGPYGRATDGILDPGTAA